MLSQINIYIVLKLISDQNTKILILISLWWKKRWDSLFYFVSCFIHIMFFLVGVSESEIILILSRLDAISEISDYFDSLLIRLVGKTGWRREISSEDNANVELEICERERERSGG